MSARFEPGFLPPSPPSPQDLWFLFAGSELLVRDVAGGVALATPAQVPQAWQYLGALEGRGCFAAAVDLGSAPDGSAPVGLRGLFGRLPEEHWWVAGRAVQVLEWDRTHRHCGACGRKTSPHPRERSRRCEDCELSFYPRLAPAIIVLVQRGEEALLGRARSFVKDFYSTLAGFVEPGESLEEALTREVNEEVGVQVKDLRYFGSQPWPFPHSLMIGFTAEYAGGELRPDGEELIDARWFRHDALPKIPPRASIARRLIDDWVERCKTRSGGV